MKKINYIFAYLMIVSFHLYSANQLRLPPLEKNVVVTYNRCRNGTIEYCIASFDLSRKETYCFSSKIIRGQGGLMVFDNEQGRDRAAEELIKDFPDAELQKLGDTVNP